jgi:hypothetical protein
MLVSARSRFCDIDGYEQAIPKRANRQDIPGLQTAAADRQIDARLANPK